MSIGVLLTSRLSEPRFPVSHGRVVTAASRRRVGRERGKRCPEAHSAAERSSRSRARRLWAETLSLEFHALPRVRCDLGTSLALAEPQRAHLDLGERDSTPSGK